jgi:hypothetical protein
VDLGAVMTLTRIASMDASSQLRDLAREFLGS